MRIQCALRASEPEFTFVHELNSRQSKLPRNTTKHHMPFKGWVHLNMKFQPLSAHPHADGKAGDVEQQQVY